jgi:hypothetical protein
MRFISNNLNLINIQFNIKIQKKKEVRIMTLLVYYLNLIIKHMISLNELIILIVNVRIKSRYQIL